MSLFFLARAEDETDEEFVTEVERSTSKILGEIFKKEYLSRRAIGGTMPQLNQVFEEMKVKYKDRRVPEKILKSVEEKATKASRSALAPVATVRAESKKRKDSDVSKAVARKWKVAKIDIDSADEVAENVHGAGDASQPQISISQPDEDLMGLSVKATAAPRVEATVVNPLPCILGDDSSEFEGDATGAGSASASFSEETSEKACRSAKA